MNEHKSEPLRFAFRPMGIAIQSLALATTASLLLWTLGGGFDVSVASIASAATKKEKGDAKPDASNDASRDAALASDPSATGRPSNAESLTVRLNYMSAAWETVLKDLANGTDSELIMDRVPRGRFSRTDRSKYTRHDAVRILNKELEPTGFRLIEKGDFLIVLDLPSLRQQYAPAVLPSRRSLEQSPRVETSANNSPKVERSVHSINGRNDEPKTAKKNGARVQQVSHAESSDGTLNSIPSPLNDDSSFEVSQVIFRPRNRTALELSKQLHRAFKAHSQLISAGRKKLPAFRIAFPNPPTSGNEPTPPSVVTIAIDEANEELLIDAAPRQAEALVKLFRLLDRPADDAARTQLTASTRYVCQVAHQLPAEIDRLRVMKQRDRARNAEPLPDWVENGENGFAQAVDVSDRPVARGNPPAGPGEQLGNLKGEVNIEAVEDLGVLILKGNEKDIDQVMEVIRKLESLSEVTAPKVHLFYLKHIDAESISELLTTVYERLAKFPGKGTQPRQSVAVLPITKPNSLLIIAPEADLNAILQLAEELDRPVDPLTEFQVFQLKSAIATQVAQMITDFYAERKNLGAKVLVVADARSNSLIVRAQARDLDEISALIRKIDLDTTGTVNELRFFPLKNAIATELAAVMNAAIQSVIAPPTSSSGGGGGGGAGQQGGVLPGLNVGQIDEQFKTMKSALLKFKMVDSKGERDIRSGILADIRITPDARVNTLIVSASEQSMSLIEELIKALDRPTTTVSEIKVFTLANADAELMVQQLNALFNNQQQGQGAGNQQRQMQNLGIVMDSEADASSSLVPLKFSVDKRTNSVIAVGAREALGVVEAILLRLDESDLRARQNVVIRLQNSQATLIAQSVQQFYQSQRDIAQSTDPNLMSSVEQLEKEVVVVPDTTNNSLLLSATPRYFKNIENMILKLDAAPRQVIIQAMLIEVELDNTDEFGIELGFQDPTLFNRSVKDAPVTISTVTQSPNGNSVQSNTILSQSGQPGFNFNNPSVPLGNNLATSPAIVASQGLTNLGLGRVNSNLGFGGLVLSAGSDAVNVLIRALSAHHKIQVLSRPQIRALDNQQAEIFSGQQIPIITGFTANGTTGVNTPTVQQQNAGIQLQVMPRITADGNVVMMLYAQRSQYRQQGVPLSTDVTGKTVSSPILDISRLSTTISVPNGNTVVIGGLINSYDEQTTNKAPFLADIPLLGSLFRYDSRTTKRVELLMFLTPRVISGPIEEELIKDVEMGRIHYIQAEAEDMHGPLRSVPAPEDIFSDDPQPVCPPQSMDSQRGIRNYGINPAPAADMVTPSPVPQFDSTVPPAPAPRPDSGANSTIRDPSFSPAAARLRYTEEDDRTNRVQQAKLDDAATTRVSKRPKKLIPAVTRDAVKSE